MFEIGCDVRLEASLGKSEGERCRNIRIRFHSKITYYKLLALC